MNAKIFTTFFSRFRKQQLSNYRGTNLNTTEMNHCNSAVCIAPGDKNDLDILKRSLGILFIKDWSGDIVVSFRNIQSNQHVPPMVYLSYQYNYCFGSFRGLWLCCYYKNNGEQKLGISCNRQARNTDPADNHEIDDLLLHLMGRPGEN